MRQRAAAPLRVSFEPLHGGAVFSREGVEFNAYLKKHKQKAVKRQKETI